MSPAIESPVLAVETAEEFKQRIFDVLSDFEKQQDKTILLSSDLDLKPLEEPSGLSRIPITWPIQDLNMFYILDAPPCSDIPEHAHQSDIFRLVMEGDLEINGIEVKAGIWMLVTKGTQYSISSKTGYKALVAYKDVCEVTGW